jgi:hypothetical protein
MAYYIFLKSLRSLEEFRKNPNDKIPPKSPSTNFQSLGKFKNPTLIQKFPFFLIFGPADPAARSASSPASPLAAPSPQAKIVPADPSGPRVGRFFAGNMFSFLVRIFPSQLPLPRLSVNRAPPIRFTPFPAPANPGRKSPVPLPRASDAPEVLQPSLITRPP